MKEFQVEGNCNPLRHYMADTSKKIDTIINTLIEKDKYFTINRARQYGKTTTLDLLYQRLKDKYLVIQISFEAEDDSFTSNYDFVLGMVRNIGRELQRAQVSQEVLDVWESPVDERFPMDDLSQKISKLCQMNGKEVVLIIDEVDRSSDNQIFLTFLGLLRTKYIGRNAGRDVTFKSVILAGVYDIKNLKLRIRTDEEQKYNSPWNVAADFTIDMSLSLEEITSMLKEYEKDHHTGMKIDVMSQLLLDYTSGYPYLVSRICKLIDERLMENDSFKHKEERWSEQGFLEAVKILLKEKNTLFDDMIKKIADHPQLKQVIRNILFRGTRYSYEADNQVLHIGIMFGFLTEHDNTVGISNRIFETKLYNYFISEDEVSSSIYEAGVMDKNQFVVDGTLQMNRVLEKFLEHFTEIYADYDDKFIEENGRRIFLMYLKPIINGVGNYYIEAQTRNMKRTDVVVDYRGIRSVVEMKIWHGAEYNKRGEQQLDEYLDFYHLEKGYMLSFNFNKKKKPQICNIQLGKRMIMEVVV